MKNIELDFGGLTKQFEGLNGRHPGLWPIAPKALLLTGVVAAIVVGGWFAYWSGLNEELESTAAQEQVLKDEYTQKVAKAVNLDDLHVPETVRATQSLHPNEPRAQSVTAVTLSVDW